MRNLLPAERYVGPDWFTREMEGWRKRCWLFAAMAQEVAEEGAWRALDLAGVPVVLWNAGGGLQAYLNVCSHRHSPICHQAAGRGRLQCPYHGWVYGEDGRVCAIPSRPKFADLTPERVEELALKRFRVARAGDFIFVALDGTVPPLEEYLGGAMGWLEEMSAGCGARAGAFDTAYAGNWKLVLENTLESYHAACVHPDTLNPGRGHDSVFEEAGPHSRMFESNAGKAERSWKLLEPNFEGRGQALAGYCHTSIFPNLNIGTGYGATYAVMRFAPLAPDLTRVECAVHGCRGPALPGGRAVLARQWFTDGVLEFVKKVVEEDRAVVEGSQRGIAFAQSDGMLSEEECRIATFQRACLRLEGGG